MVKTLPPLQGAQAVIPAWETKIPQCRAAQPNKEVNKSSFKKEKYL